MTLTKFIIFSFLLVGFENAVFAQGSAPECQKGQVTCNGNAAVKVDLGSKCACIKDECFKVAIGKNGPTQTHAGHGRIRKAQGAKYQTTPGPGTTSYDKDALDMGIQENTAVGKWLHKPQGCGSVEGNNGLQTKGCIAIPCDMWPKLKEQIGEELEVCGGGAPMSSQSGAPDPKGNIHHSWRGSSDKNNPENAEDDDK